APSGSGGSLTALALGKSTLGIAMEGGPRRKVLITSPSGRRGRGSGKPVPPADRPASASCMIRVASAAFPARVAIVARRIAAEKSILMNLFLD
ncbi:MAG TPA: hypothetical protein VMO81_08415, partial [Aestuariivirgaceae bacterium]|nr:hypothetical protein [Aestuariivirgaceae bacterium]